MHPILFKFGPITIRYYGLMYVIAFFIGIFLLKKEVKRKEIILTDDNILNLALWVYLFGLIGARIYYVTFNWDYYGMYPKEIPAIWHGGLAIHGGLLGGILAGYLFTKKNDISFLPLADATVPSIILGQALGRFGNFMNGDAHGVPTELPWGLVFPETSIAGSQFGPVPLHPTMLYEMILNLCIFLFLWKIRKRNFHDGFLFSLYLILYSIGRFFVCFFRADALMLGSIRIAQGVSILLIFGLGCVVLRRRLWEVKS